MKEKLKKTMWIALVLVMLITALPFNVAKVYAAEGVAINESNFPDAKFREYVKSNLQRTVDDTLSQEELNAIVKIDVPRKRIKSLKGIEHFTDLRVLVCHSNQLTSLDISKNPALITLDCSLNQVTALDISQNPSLKTLICNSNRLTSLDVSENPALKGLNCAYNQLRALDVSNNSALTTLNCGTSQLTTLDISKNPALITLNCAYNQLRALDVSKNLALTTLNCRLNKLTTLDVSKNPALTTLNCRLNKLTTLDVSKNPALNQLVCWGNQLTALKLPSSPINIKEISQKYTISVPKGSSIIEFPAGFDASKIQGTVKGLTPTASGIEWDEQTKPSTINYQLCDNPQKIADVELIWTDVSNPALEAATQLVVKAEAEKTEENYRAAKTAVDALVKGSGKTGLEERLKAIRSYLDELKTSKEQAKTEIGQLQNLTKEEKAPFTQRVEAAQTKEQVDQAVADAKAKNEENGKTATEEDKNTAKEEIGKLPNLSDTEKDQYKKKVDDATTKGDVAKVVEEAKAKSEENGKPATENDKNTAKDTIDQLPNLSEGEKNEAKGKVDNAGTKGDVAKVVEDAKAKNEENGKTATTEDKNAAKTEIGNLPKLSDTEKDQYKKKVDDATTKGQVNQAVEDARAKDAENKNAADALDAKKQELIGKLDTKVNGKDVFDQDKKDALKDQINRAGNKEDLKAVEEEINKAIEAAGQVVPKPAPQPIPQAPGIRFFVLAPERQGQKPVEVKKTNQMTLETIIKIGSKKLTRIINGESKEVEMDVAAYADKDRTYIPLRFVGEAMGFDVRWDKEARMAILKNKDKEVKVSVDSNIFYVNGEKFESDVKPQIKNDRTMIPVGNFARCLGLKDGKDIFWDQGSQQVTIKQVVNY